MDYFSGISGQSLTFGVMMSICLISIMILVIGFIFNFKKWSYGSLGYGMDPQENEQGNSKIFLRAFKKQLTSNVGVHHGQSWINTLIFDILLQRRVYRRNKIRWFMHICIFFGWMGLFALSGLMFLVELTHMYFEHFKPHLLFDLDSFREVLQVPNQILGYILLIGVIIALIRRLFIKSIRENSNLYDWVLIISLLTVVITGFIAHAGRYIAPGVSTFSGIELIFLDYKIWTLGGMIPFLTYVKEIALIHSFLALFIGFAYIPFSKYIHVLATPMSLLVNKGGEN